MHAGFWLGNLKARDHLEHAGVDRRIILKCSSKEYGDRSLIGLNWLRKRQVAGSCKHGNEPLGAIKCREFLD